MAESRKVAAEEKPLPVGEGSRRPRPRPCLSLSSTQFIRGPQHAALWVACFCSSVRRDKRRFCRRHHGAERDSGNLLHGPSLHGQNAFRHQIQNDLYAGRKDDPRTSCAKRQREDRNRHMEAQREGFLHNLGTLKAYVFHRCSYWRK
jgi:hypothetical protein